MKDLQIAPTKTTPLIDFFASGKLIFAGSAYPENAKEFFDPIIDWIIELETEIVDFDLIVEYINTSAAKKLLELLQKLHTALSNKSIDSVMSLLGKNINPDEDNS